MDDKDNYIGQVPQWLARKPSLAVPRTITKKPSFSEIVARGLPGTREALVERLLKHFTAGGEGHRVLEGLQNLQRAFDPQGILEHEPTEEFLLAMTLRDCSLYVQVHWSEDGTIESRLGDLDPKVAKGGKLEQWRETERTLIKENWYCGEDKTCLLSRHRQAPPTGASQRR